MYPPTTAAQKPETFQMSSEAQQSLPPDVQRGLHEVDRLKYFLISAPVDLKPNTLINTHALPTGDLVSCVYWNGLFHISGTDIVRCLSFRFQAFGRPVRNTKKFEEGIFSDLRNLKSGTDATLEEPKSPFLDFLYKNNCIRTQKKQKVFYWYHVPHDRLFLDALERDLKREKMGQDPTTVAVSEPALSFEFDASISLFEQLTKAQQQQASSTAAVAAAGLPFATNPNGTAANASVSSASSSAYAALPMVPTAESMPPPPPRIRHPTVTPMPPMITDDMYNPVGMPLSVMNNPMVKVEQHGSPDTPYDRSYDKRNVSLSRLSTRHASMPAYVEYSPVPSFVSSQFDDYGVATTGGHPASRGMSFEPVTPPSNSAHQIHAMAPPSGPDTRAYIGNEDGIYTPIPDMSTPTTSAAHPATYDSLLPMSSSHLPAIGQSFPNPGHGDIRSYSDPQAMYPIVEGSPRFERKDTQQARSVSDNVMPGHQIMPSMQHHATPGDLSRAVSITTSIPDSAMMSMDSSPSGTHMLSHQNSPALTATGLSGSRLPQRDVYQNFSRHETPLPTFEEDPATQQRVGTPGSFLNGAMASDLSPHPRLNLGPRVQASKRPHLAGPVRRARSATVLDVNPYSHPSMHGQHPDSNPHAGMQYHPSHLSSVPPLPPPSMNATATPPFTGPNSVNRTPGQKALTCPQPGCGRVCKRLEHLKRHYRTHTDDRPYECSHCGKKFSRSDNLGQHKRTHERQATQGSVGSGRDKIRDASSPPQMLGGKEGSDILDRNDNDNERGVSTTPTKHGYNMSTSASTSATPTIAIEGVTTPTMTYETNFPNQHATPAALQHHQMLRQHSETPLSHPSVHHAQGITLSDS